MTDYIYCDFEYRPTPAGLDLICACILNHTTQERVTLDLRTDAHASLSRTVAQWPDAIWLAYAAHAELTAFLTALVPVHAMQWIDLMAEARQITATHGRLYLHISDTNLVSTLGLFGIPYQTGTKADKAKMIELILNTPDLSPEQFAQVTAYCWTDVEPLPALWQAIQGVFRDYKVPHDPRVARFHGEYIKATAELDHSSRGFPIDVPLLHRLYGNRKAVCKHLAEQANRKYGGLIYVYNKVADRYSFHFAGLKKLLDSLPTDERPAWKLTQTGRLRTDSEYMEEVCEGYPFFLDLKRTLDLLHQFAERAVDLRTMEHDGFIKGVSLPLHTVTGRDGKLVSRGFIFGMPPFLRSLVRPPPGFCLVGADWSQQEIAIASALSGDTELQAALDTGDVYLSLAKMAKAVPETATKKSHPLQRQMYKSCQLGIGFGMMPKSLGKKILLDMRTQGDADMNLDEATLIARDIHYWHKHHFRQFWDFTNDYIRESQRLGYAMTFDRWTRFCNQMTTSTALGNYPIQATAATIMREAVKLLAAQARIDPSFEWLCSLHDALYLMCRERYVEQTKALLQRVMSEATATVLRHARMPLTINVDINVYTHAEGYHDDRDTTTLPLILAMLDARDQAAEELRTEAQKHIAAPV